MLRFVLYRPALFIFLTLLALVCPGVGPHALAALNTFGGTGPLTAARTNHTATLLPTGKILVAGGSNGSGAYFVGAQLYDPATGVWTATGNLGSARAGHTATLLASGKVLVVGGTSGSALDSAELYDAVTGLWSPAGHLSTARSRHTATLLATGKVLVAGGAGTNSLSSNELYDPSTNSWTGTGSLATAREGHTATLLPDGKVLLAGGAKGLAVQVSAELYDPATGVCDGTGNLLTARVFHTATLLLNGKVLAVGGQTAGSTGSAELYNPATGQWASTAAPAAYRYFHTASLLPDGQLLIAGGHGYDGGTTPAGTLGTSEVYDSINSTWSSAGNLGAARESATATVLPSGLVLVAGGANAGASLASAELFDSSGVWVPTGNLKAARSFAQAILLADGRVLVAGGSDGNSALNTAELYDPVTGTWSATGSLATPRESHVAILLPNQKVLVVGGDNGTSGLSSMEVYDPQTGLWSLAGNLAHARAGATATLLQNGLVLIAGGYDASAELKSAELYNPANGTIAGTGDLAVVRYGHTATLLPNGKVLAAGGGNFQTYYATAELYDPATGQWAAAGSMTGGARDTHSATLLPSGKVLVAGGTGGTVLRTASLYDPTTNGWTATGSMVSLRYAHAATLLPSGKVLVTGGINTVAFASTEQYDPATGTFATARAMNSARYAHNATLLPGGSLLVTAGAITTGAIAKAEFLNTGAAFLGAPAIATATSFYPGDALVLAGSRFLGLSAASGGGTQDSSTNYPIVQIRNVTSQQTSFALPSASLQPSATSFSSAPLGGLAQGSYEATVFVNGVPSNRAAFQVLPPAAPSATSLAATPITPTTATLRAEVSANGAATAVRFAYATDPTLNRNVTFTLPQQNLASDSYRQIVGQPVTGLSPHTTYYYQVLTTNALGETPGAITSFVTGNTPPVALSDTVSIPSNQPAQITLPFASMDADGDSVTLVQYSASAGSVQSAGPKTLTLTPPNGFAGPITLNYSISDGLESAAGTITVTVLDASPTITLQGSNPVIVAYGGSYVEPGASATDDVDGRLPVTITGSVNPLVPAPYTITYTATDSAQHQTIVTRTVLVSLQPAPVAVADHYFSGSAKLTPLTLNVLANDTAYHVASLAITAVTRPLYGSVALSSDHRALVYTPRISYANFSGEDSFAYTVKDDFGGTATGRVTIGNGAYRQKGVYDGLLTGRTGHVLVNLTATGSFTGTLKVGIASLPLHGQLDLNNRATLNVPNGTLQLQFDGDSSFTATLATSSAAGTGTLTHVTFNAANNPAPLAGAYTLLLPAPVASGGSAASATATVSPAGKITALNLQAGGSSYLVPPLVTILDPKGSGATATATLTSGAVTGLTVTKPGAAYKSATVRVLIDAPADALPGGPGYAAMTISQTGPVVLAGKLGDGTPLSGSGYLKADGTIALYSILASKTGPASKLAGLLTFQDVPGISDFDGDLEWTKPAQNGPGLYRAGFALTVPSIGSHYVPPAKNEQALIFTNPVSGTGIFDARGADLAAAVQDTVSVSSANVIKETSSTADQLALKITPASGLLTGSFRASYPNGASAFKSASAPLSGVLFQKQNLGHGLLIGPRHTGAITLTPQ